MSMCAKVVCLVTTIFVALGAKHGTDRRHWRKTEDLQRTLELRSIGIGDFAVDGGASAYIWVNGCTVTGGAHWCST